MSGVAHCGLVRVENDEAAHGSPRCNRWSRACSTFRKIGVLVTENAVLSERYVRLASIYHLSFHRVYPMLSHAILSHPILSYPILSYPILSYPILSYPILSYSVPSCPVLLCPVYPSICIDSIERGTIHAAWWPSKSLTIRVLLLLQYLSEGFHTCP